MNNNEDQIQRPTASTVEINKSPFAIVAVKVVSYLAGLAVWFFIGGFFSVGPRIAHNIDKAVGNFVLDATFITWAALPATALIALIAPTKATLGALSVNAISWLAFLASLYIRWHLAYP